MKIIELFPTVIATFHCESKEKFKNIFEKEYGHLQIKDIGEHNGQNGIHNNENLEEFFKFVISSMSDYLKSLGINIENFYLVLGKTWLSFVNSEIAVPMHNHGEHHLSFTYYFDVPGDSMNQICFTDSRNNINEPFYGAFNPVDGIKPHCVKENAYNSKTYKLTIDEGTLCVFPSRLNHWTFNSEVERKCIAGDILLIQKTTTNKNPWGLYPQESWKYYETKMD
jgi:hypothetical protein